MQELRISPEKIHPVAVEVCRILQEANYQAFIVGGCVRDLLLGQAPKDWDICTDAQPEEVIRLFPKTIPTGLQHGTVTVCMGEGVDNHFEVTTFRVEGKYLDGRRPESVAFVQDVQEDLARRDLTINAMAYNPISEELVDPYGGLDDLNKGLIRAVGNAEMRFQEDGLRIMRVARFAARFGYHISLPTLEGMKNSLDTLKKVSKERISDELSKTLLAKHSSLGLHVLQDSGALDIACPLLAGRQLPLLSKQDTCVGELETRLAFLYNRIDITQVEKELIALKFSTREVKKAIFLQKVLDLYYITKIREQNSPVPDFAYRYFIAFIKNEAIDTPESTLREFVTLAEALGEPIKEMLEKYRNEPAIGRKDMNLNGDDLLAAGMKPGPQIKKVLDKCYTAVLQHPENNTKKFLLEMARQID